MSSRLYQMSKNWTAAQKKAYINKHRPSKKSNISKKVKTLEKKVKQLDKTIGQGELIYRKRECYNVASSVNSCGVSSGAVNDLNTLTNLEAVLTNLKYYDPAAPTALVTASGLTGTYSKKFHFATSYHKIKLSNNFRTPVNVRFYILETRDDTSLTPNSAYQNGLADVGGPSASSPLVYPTDSPQLMELFKIARSEVMTLEAGQSKDYSYSCKPFDYDPSISDNHNLEYQKAFNGSAILIRVEGPLGHDGTLDEQGILQSELDVMVNSTWKVLYDAGAEVKDIVVQDNSSSFTNSGLIVNRLQTAQHQNFSRS